MSWFSRIFQFKKNLERPLSVLNEVLLSEKSLLDNYDYLQSLDENIELFPVLKSNAYGHGIEQVATILKKRNPRYIVLDSYYEALRVHEVNDAKILLIGYNLPENYPLMDFSWVTPVVTELQTLKVLGKLDRPITIHIKIDTGMRRQGILMDEIPEFLRIMNMYPKIKLEGICTHLADADNPKDRIHSFFQLEHFSKAIATIESFGHILRYKHIENSAGHLKGIGKGQSNVARVGIALYGINPLDPKDNFFEIGEKLSPVIELRSKVVSVKSLSQGERVSYGLTFKAPWDMKIGIIPVGYYEGLPRSLSGEDFCVSYDGKNLPILGKICMNMCIIDITNTDISIGDNLTVYSNNRHTENTIQAASRKANMIPYEVLVNIAESIRRRIVN